MSTLHLSPKQTLTYDYDPFEDVLSIRLSEAHGTVVQEALAHSDHLSLRRDVQSGEVVGVVVTGVQPLLLERLVRDLFFELRPLLSRAVPVTAATGEEPAATPEPAAEPVALERVVEEEQAAEAPPELVATTPPEAVPLAEHDTTQPEDALDGPGPGSTEQTDEEADDSLSDAEQADDEEADESLDAAQTAVAESEEDEEPKKKRRRRRRGGRRRKKGSADDEQESPEEQPAPVVVDESIEDEAVEDEPRRGKRRKRDPEESDDAGTRVDAMEGRSAPIPGLDAPESFAFMGLHPHIGQVITVLGFEQPTPIQRRAVPEIMAGKDVIGLSQTGTGKTLGFLVPALHRLVEENDRRHRPKVLVLTPTRELAVQVADEANTLAMHTDLRITTLYGGAPMGKQIRELKRGVDIVVATPGRLMDHMRRGNVRLDSVEYLVLDEADRMLDMGFLPDVRTILRDLPRKRQTLFFSATMPPPIEALSLEMQKDPVLVEVARQTPAEGIEQAVFPVERHLKLPLLLHLLNRDDELKSVLVFTETKAEADIVGRKLREEGINVVVMHGDLNQRQREHSLSSLGDRSARVLVATNVAARGLDISAISHIVNYDMPQGVDDYVHRIGRTARGAAEGHAFTFVSLGDEGMLRRIESALERELPRVTVEDFDYDVETPSWAKPSAEEIAARLTKPGTLAERFKSMMGRRR